MRALLALPLLLLALVPTVAAADLEPASPDPIQCLFEPYFPETLLYYIVWWCTAGQLGVPEPIEFLTGCTLGFPITHVHCDFAAVSGLVGTVGDRVERVDYCVEYRPTVGCVMGMEPDPVACLVNYIRTQTPCR